MKVLSKINDVFGFGIIDNWVFVYAGGNAVCGIGTGMLLASTYHISLMLTAVLGVVLVLGGGLLANIAHSVLKKNAKQRIEMHHRIVEQSARGNAEDRTPQP